MYGKDLVHNAVDISTDVANAKNDIHSIFGDLDKDEQGEKIDLFLYKISKQKKSNILLLI
jgi:hypothetical protein